MVNELETAAETKLNAYIEEYIVEGWSAIERNGVWMHVEMVDYKEWLLSAIEHNAMVEIDNDLKMTK